MSEDEAKTKWCPFARTISAVEGSRGLDVPTGQAAFNRVDILGKQGAHMQASTACVASACMAWRAERGTPTYAEDFTTIEGPVIGGFCGLAGAPQ